MHHRTSRPSLQDMQTDAHQIPTMQERNGIQCQPHTQHYSTDCKLNLHDRRPHSRPPSSRSSLPNAQPQHTTSEHQPSKTTSRGGHPPPASLRSPVPDDPRPLLGPLQPVSQPAQANQSPQRPRAFPCCSKHPTCARARSQTSPEYPHAKT